MILRSGLALNIPVLFDEGQPDGEVTWSVFSSAGLLLGSDSVVVPADAVSITLTVPAPLNTLAADQLIGTRDLTWTYVRDGLTVTDELRYSLENRIPFGASADGVRAKLGIEKDDLPDSDIALARAYIAFRNTATLSALLAISDEGENDLVLRDAIEATAALALLPTMIVRIAKSEDSGTNKYQRQDVDWEVIGLTLAAMVNDALLLALPGYDPFASAGALFLLATPATDAITGA